MTVAAADRVLHEVRAHGRRDLRRDALTIALGAVMVAALVAVMLMVGAVPVSPADVWLVLTGHAVPGAGFVVGELRLPRAIGAVITGAAFGVSGAIFQTMLRNALATPDVIGINAGASVAAVIAISLGISGIGIAALAFGGAVVTALLVWVLAYRRGFSDLRFVLVGVAIGTGLQALVAYVLTKIQLAQAEQAVVWMTGSLNRSLWDTVTPALIALAVLLPVVVIAARPLAALRLGDDVAAMLGVRVQASKIVLVITAVALAAVATSVAGPLAFVAFLAGPIATRLVRREGTLLIVAALTGAAIVAAADLIGQHLVGIVLPAGVVTGIAGGPVLLWLLLTGRTRL